MIKMRLIAVAILLAGIFVGYFVYASEPPSQNVFSGFPFRLGLDLAGGTHLVYRAEVSALQDEEVSDSMEALRDVIERRVNLFGVAEPLVHVETTAGIISDEAENRLVVELPGVTNVDEAVAMIGQTPFLEFRLEIPEGPEKDAIREKLEAVRDAVQKGETPPLDSGENPIDAFYLPTELTGRFLERATLTFNSLTGEPRVSIEFNDEGSEVFSSLTRENIGSILAIYLDGAPISLPVIREEIDGGSAEITGDFNAEEAKTLVGRLNSGALPVPIELLSTQTVGATLGQEARERGVDAGVIGLTIVAIFMVLWYRLPGVVAVLALGMYVSLMLAFFKITSVTLTAAGGAGFILSIGMAVDANVLIFERMKEELRKGNDLSEAILGGFKRAWLAIRDSNISSMITAIVLFWFGTSTIQGFALVFGIGVLVSMITAVTVSRTLLFAISSERVHGALRFFFGSGIK